MKKNYLLFLALWVAAASSAQQEQMYTQFYFNKLAYNPAYAGSFVSPTLTAVHRSQWIGLDGAPNAQALSYHQSMVNERVGIGGSLFRQQIGINTSLTLDAAYAYRVKMRRGTVCVGLEFNIRNFRQNWADPRIVPIQGNDGGIPVEPKSKFLPNMSTGIYYVAYHDKWYAGLSVQRLFGGNIDFAEVGEFASEVQHINAMGGMSFEANEDLTVTPQALLRYAIGAPFDAEANVSVMLKKKFHGGLSYRIGGDKKQLGESVDIMLGMQVTENLFFSLSYDIGISQLRKFNNGSLEAVARWWFNPPADVDEIVPPTPF
jgi:type IX secretion system PorP/SprF family membrane protein